MKDLGQEALEEMNRLLLNQKRLKMKLERMGDNQIADLSKKVERLQEKLNEANEVIKWYDGLENILIDWEMLTGQPKGTANKYLKKWGVK